MSQAGPKYDNAMKAMCAQVPAVLCRWLGLADDDDPDRAVRVVRLSEMAPKAATHQVDALLAVGEHLVVHVEFQTAGEVFFGWRMLDYRSLLVRRPEIAGKVLCQHVVVLGRDTIEPGVHDNEVDYNFTVHNVRDESVDSFLTDPALAPFAVPVPSAMDEIGELYAQDARHEYIASLLDYRFGPDERIPEIARGLVTSEPAGTVRLIEEAKSLDELAVEG